jgi:hypothetical protein
MIDEVETFLETERTPEQYTAAELLDLWDVERKPIELLAADNSTHDGPAAAEFLLNNPHLWEMAFTNADLDALSVLPAAGYEFRLAVDLAQFGHDTYQDITFSDGSGNSYTFLHVWWD